MPVRILDTGDPGNVVGTPAPPATNPAPPPGGGGGGSGGGGGDAPPPTGKPGEKHPVQPKPTQTPPLNIPGSYHPGRVSPAIRAHPTAALDHVMHQGGGITMPAAGASTTPRPKVQAHPTHALVEALGRVHASTRRASPSGVLHAAGSQVREPAGLDRAEAGSKAAKWSFRTKEKYAFEYLRKTAHLTPIEAAGILGNLIQESQLRQGYQNPFGIAQWTRGRITALKSYASQRHENPGAFTTQVAFIPYELHHTEQAALHALLTSRTLDQATAAIFNLYERAGDASLGKREGYALSVLELYQRGLI